MSSWPSHTCILAYSAPSSILLVLSNRAHTHSRTPRRCGLQNGHSRALTPPTTPSLSLLGQVTAGSLGGRPATVV